ncbi:MAG TPA: hypothetical protein VHA52_01640, partial [Candidatus Babeliaceae bacterium]|nr:hypothetical protein [Candidatus Babeliaceae bacterium]
ERTEINKVGIDLVYQSGLYVWLISERTLLIIFDMNILATLKCDPVSVLRTVHHNNRHLPPQLMQRVSHAQRSFHGSDLRDVADSQKSYFLFVNHIE